VLRRWIDGGTPGIGRSAIESLEVIPAPETNGLGKGQHCAPIVGERIHDGGRDASRSVSIDDAVADQFAELLGEDLRRNPWHQPAELQKLTRRLGEPVNHDEFPFTANRRERGSHRTAVHRIPSSRAKVSYFKVLTSGHGFGFVRMTR
jgi:hypothetical protein